jgi:hypothetical protein
LRGEEERERRERSGAERRVSRMHREQSLLATIRVRAPRFVETPTKIDTEWEGRRGRRKVEKRTKRMG